MTKVKICGLSRPEDIEAVNAYGADYAGFVFFEKSKRNVGYEKAEKLLRQLKKNPNIQSVAVCVSPSREEVKRLNDMGFDLIQIHGTIPADCQSDGGLALWQAVNIAGSSDVNAEELFVQAPNISGYVVDGAEYGSGKTLWMGSGRKNICISGKIKKSESPVCFSRRFEYRKRAKRNLYAPSGRGGCKQWRGTKPESKTQI